MNELKRYCREHDLATYADFQAHAGVLNHEPFTEIIPSNLAWSDKQDGQLQRGFAAGAPLGAGSESRFIDGTDSTISKGGWFTRLRGKDEFTNISKQLNDTHGIRTKDDLHQAIEDLSLSLADHVRVYRALHPLLLRLMRGEVSTDLHPEAITLGSQHNLEEGTVREWWPKLAEPFEREDSVLILPSPSRLPTDLMAWHARRLSSLVWMGTRIGLISLNDSVDGAPIERYLRAMTATIQERYRDWTEFQDAYHVGLAVSGATDEVLAEDHIIGTLMLHHPDSPWVRMPLRGENPMWEAGYAGMSD